VSRIPHFLSFPYLAQYAHFHIHPTPCSNITVTEAVKHFSLFAHFLSGIAVLIFYYCGNQEEKDKYLNRILVACMSLLFMAIALPPFGLPKPESHDLQNKGFTIPKISQEPLKKKA
jgi:cellulose synthase/poly-beta-1,6-N-acetylglucosamine synthase-like glycosyltransferase